MHRRLDLTTVCSITFAITDWSDDRPFLQPFANVFMV